MCVAVVGNGNHVAPMSDVAIAAPSRPIAPIERKERPIGKRVRAAIDAMVWQGLPRREAAEQAGLKEHSLYKALRRSPVLALYRSECQVLRESERARNIHRAREIRDAADNMPAVHAMKYIDGDYGEQQQRSNGLSASAGVTIRIVNVMPGAAPIKQIDGDILNQNATNET